MNFLMGLGGLLMSPKPPRVILGDNILPGYQLQYMVNANG